MNRPAGIRIQHKSPGGRLRLRLRVDGLRHARDQCPQHDVHGKPSGLVP